MPRYTCGLQSLRDTFQNQHGCSLFSQAGIPWALDPRMRMEPYTHHMIHLPWSEKLSSAGKGLVVSGEAQVKATPRSIKYWFSYQPLKAHYTVYSHIYVLFFIYLFRNTKNTITKKNSTVFHFWESSVPRTLSDCTS